MIKYFNSHNFKKNPFFDAIKSGYFYNPCIQGKMNVAVFLSGIGSNFKRLLKYQRELKNQLGEKTPFEIGVVVSDTKNGYFNAKSIISEITGSPKSIPTILLESKKVVPKKFLSTTDKKILEEGRLIYDKITAKKLEPYKINFGILAGYKRLVSPWFIKRIACINVHPAPLNIVDPFSGERSFTGNNAVKKQILAGCKFLQSTVHIVRKGADTGEILMLSEKTPVELEGMTLKTLELNPKILKKIVDSNQKKLKLVGDFKIFPKVILLSALGKYRFDKFGKISLNLNSNSCKPEDIKYSEFKNILKQLLIKNNNSLFLDLFKHKNIEEEVIKCVEL